MTKKVIKLKDKTIKVWERTGFILQKLQVTEQKQKFDQECKTLLVLFAKLAKANKLPKNSEEIINSINQSYKNCDGTFTKRKPYAVVLDVDDVLNQLV